MADSSTHHTHNKDGTGQAQRFPLPLNPESIPVDERSIGDWIRFAQACAKELVFFDADNNPAGTWEKFLGDSTETGNTRFIADLLSYIENPGRFINEPEKTQKFSKPHLALFVSFLQLMAHVKSQLNGFTRKHLHFYYSDVLGLNKKRPVPDMINLIIELADDVNNLLLERGTSFIAGKDSLGKDLVYQTQKHTVVSGAKVQKIKTLFVDKKIKGIKEIRESNRDDTDRGFMKMMRLALGDPEPGDALPDHVTDLRNADQEYVANKLFLTPGDFEFLLRINNSSEIKTGADWNKAYQVLEEAYKEKTKRKRQQALREIREASAEEGFARMFRKALGDPGEGDELPVYKSADLTANGTSAVLTLVYKHLINGSQANRAAALNYVTSELRLRESEFKTIMETYLADITNRKTPSKNVKIEWAFVYKFLEIAERKKRNFILPAPLKTEWLNIYAIDDARAGAFSIDNRADKSSLRFNTFGKTRSDNELKGVQPATIGFAVASPQLLLHEGKRKIILTIAFREDKGKNTSQLTESLKAYSSYHHFSFYLSLGDRQWLSLTSEQVRYGDVVLDRLHEGYKATVTNNRVTKETGKTFGDSDRGKYLLWGDGSVFVINSIENGTAVVSLVRKIVFSDPTGNVITCDPADLYVNAIQFQLTFDEDNVATDIPGLPAGFLHKREEPLLAMVLNQVPEKSGFISLYQHFKDFQLERIAVNVQVENIRNLVLQNDQSILDYKKPFEPFGYLPEPGSKFYFAHPEISSKRLDILSLNFEWMNPPEEFKKHYAEYWQVDLAKENLPEASYTIRGNDAFSVKVQCADNGVRLSPQQVGLFDSKDARKQQTATLEIEALSPGLTSDSEEAVNWKRHFSLELQAPDFQQHLYPELLTRQAYFDPVKNGEEYTAHPLRKLVLKPPYTPKLKSFTAGYTASLQIDLQGGISGTEERIYHITPFGFKEINLKGKAFFLPYFTSEGELYIGLSQLKAPQSLPILFQMAEGSANPDLQKPPVLWSYLGRNEWKDLKGTSILSDSTNGLLNTGIIEFSIPEDASCDNTLVSEGLHWLLARVDNNADAIPDTIDIFSNGINAVFADDENAVDHLQNPLPVESIKETIYKIPEVKKVLQPFTSFRGKPAETDMLFYRRVSERLRHKNRAVTAWDYERLVLEQFPEIYKVKCVPADLPDHAGMGSVDLIVIPDIKGKLPFDPFQPKVPQNTIYQIQKYIDQRMPVWAETRVKNPAYVQVMTRFAVKFKQGYNEGFFLQKLEEDLKRFLSPWAYEEGADIIINGKIHANVIVNYIAERPYTDYVAGMKLFRGNEQGGFDDVLRLGSGENVVEAGRPDVILVSAQEHMIDLIREQGYIEEDFSGINYMKIEYDFTVA